MGGPFGFEWPKSSHFPPAKSGGNHATRKKMKKKNPPSNGNQIRPKNPWGATKQMPPFPRKNPGSPHLAPSRNIFRSWSRVGQDLGPTKQRSYIEKTPSKKNLRYPKRQKEKSKNLHLQKGPLKKGILVGTRRVIAQISSSSWTWSLLAWLVRLVYGQVVYLWRPSLGWGQEKPSKAEKFLQNSSLNHQALPYLEDHPI